jgi:hypothetical protein
MLTAAAIQSLAVTFAPDVIPKLAESDQFMEFMQDNIPALIESEVGDLPDDDKVELALAIIEKVQVSSY